MTTSYQKDYYSVLGLESSASQQEIKDSYRKLAFQNHPDKNQDDPGASDKMKAINEAYAVLSDPVKRQEYDLLKGQYGNYAEERYRQYHTQEDIFRGSDIEQIFEEFSRTFGFRDYKVVFHEFHGTSEQSFKNRSSADLPALQMGYAGRLIKFILEKIFRIQIPERGRDWFNTLTINPTLARLGGEVKFSYRRQGVIKNLMVKIPPGTKNGQIIKLSGMGGTGKAGGASGNLFLTVSIKESWLEKLRKIFSLNK